MPDIHRRATLGLMTAQTVSAGMPAGDAMARPTTPPATPIFRPVRIRDFTIGEGRPGTIVSITGSNADEVVRQARRLGGRTDIDIVEYRLDHLHGGDDPATVTPTLEPVTAAISGKPLIVTFRTKAEGGEQEITPESFARLYETIAAHGKGDLFDIQLALMEHPAVTALKGQLQGKGLCVILSAHDFHKTPATETLLSLLRQQQRLGADICKIATMPQDFEDVMRLMQATWTMRRDFAERPLFTMAMGGIGALSRLGGEAFGSSLAVGSAGEASAPGQIDIGALHATTELLHKAIAS